MSNGQTIQFVVPANLHYSSFVRHISEEMFKRVKFPKEWCSRLKLVVDELFMNAVKYGSTQYKSSIHISCSCDESEIQFTIEDDGTGPESVPAEELQQKIQQNEQNTDLTRTSGRGLSMITKQWTDGMEIRKSEYGGIAITFTKKLQQIDGQAEDQTMPTHTSQQAGGRQVEDQIDNQVEGQIDKAEAADAPKPEDKVMPANCPNEVLKLDGEIDQSNVIEKTAPVFEYVKTMPEGCGITLDFADLEYINSTFIGNLASWYSTVHKKKGYVRLINVNSQIREVLNLVGLTDLIDII